MRRDASAFSWQKLSKLGKRGKCQNSVTFKCLFICKCIIHFRKLLSKAT